MTTLLSIVLINAIAVLPLAVLACIVGRLARRPALTHAVWVLVLLKFVTPPLFQLPVTIEMPTTGMGRVFDAPESLPVSHSKRLGQSPALDGHAARAEASTSDTQTVVSAESRNAAPRRVGRDTPSIATSALKSAANSRAWQPELRSMLLAGWLTGAVFWTALQIFRALRFQRRVLCDAKAHAELQQQTERLATALGLRRGPRVLIVKAVVSPMLWGCGSRALLLFPSDLAERLDDEARATLLTHELAHFARGDHWVRLLELIATGMFWWHPVVWWARWKIEESEEECCDAWVVGQFPNAPRQYAEALLDTIDFLCESRPPLPPVACGLGQAHFLRHRLTKIMRGAAPKAMSPRVRFALALIAALLLPLQPFVFGSQSRQRLRLAGPTAPSLATLATPVDLISPPDEPSAPTMDSPPISFSAEPMLPAVAPAALPASRSRIARGEKIWSMAASPDGRFVVRATTARRIVLTDLSTNAETDLSEQRITAVAFAPDGEWFAAAGQDGRVTIWDAARGELLRTVTTHADALRSVAVSPRGQTLAAGSRDGSVLLIDLDTDESLANVPSYPSAVNCVRFSSDGRQLAVAVGDWMSNARGEVALLNAITGQTEATLPCASSPGALTFASNDELIVGQWDGRTQLWNLVNRQVVGSAMANKNVVSAAVFSPDNPALREAMFVAEEPTPAEQPSPLSVLRSLFAIPK